MNNTAAMQNKDTGHLEQLILNGFSTKLIMPKEKDPVLFLVDHTCGDPDTPLDTWFGYRIGNKWMGVATDNAGWQEMAGPVLCWIPFPELKV